jgi:L-threonylcarbamoyladenylate synthase
VTDELTVQVKAVVAALRAGGAVVLPTDTVYGLVALPGDPVATERLFDLKGRGTEAPVAVLCADVDQALALVDPADAAAVRALRAVAERWWPGPLTLVAQRRPGAVLHLGEPSTTVGLRVPDHALVQAVMALVGPIAATSANRHGDPTPTTSAAAVATLGQGVALVVDGGPLTGAASTVLDTTIEPWRVLREGELPISDILATARGEADPAT